MKITNIQTQYFGKKKVSTCLVANRNSKQKNPAIIWEYNTNSQSDLKAIINNKQLPDHLKDDFINAYSCGGGSEKLYLLKDQKARKVIGYAQTTHRIRPKSDLKCEKITQIDEISTDFKYINTMEPIIAQIVKEADERQDECVFIGIHKDELPRLKNIKFSESKFDELYIPRKKYQSIIDKAQERFSIDFRG